MGTTLGIRDGTIRRPLWVLKKVIWSKKVWMCVVIIYLMMYIQTKRSHSATVNIKIGDKTSPNKRTLKMKGQASTNNRTFKMKGRALTSNRTFKMKEQISTSNQTFTKKGQASTSNGTFKMKGQASTSNRTFTMKEQASTSNRRLAMKGQASTSNQAFKMKGQASISNRTFKMKGKASTSNQTLKNKGHASTSNPTFKMKGQASTSNRTFKMKGEASTSNRTFRMKEQASPSNRTFKMKRQASTSNRAFKMKDQASTSNRTFKIKGQASTSNQTFTNKGQPSTRNRTFKMKGEASTNNRTFKIKGQASTSNRTFKMKEQASPSNRTFKMKEQASTSNRTLKNKGQASTSNQTFKMKGEASTSNRTFKMKGEASPSNGKFQVLWYNPPPFLSVLHKDTLHNCGFEKCKYSNCYMTLNQSEAQSSRAVIFDGRNMPKNLNFLRPNGQIWIFAAHEAPLVYDTGGNWWYKNKKYLFNWTMTYNKENTDIFLPYGEIQRYKNEVKRDFKSIARNKNKTLLIIVTHCKTHAKRQEYVKMLQKYIDVDVLGLCGKKWNCGIHYEHDECFQLLNTTYKFYLAFENALCHQYFTEKFYENFNYDLIMLTRGGSPGEAKHLFPDRTYIATEDFKTIKDLGHYLKNLSVDEYAHLLQRKSQFYSVGYMNVYQRAMCNICERMNLKNKYAKTIKNMKEWAFGLRPCRTTKDVKDIK